MFKCANLLFILITFICSKNKNDYIFLNQLEMKTDTSLLKSKFKDNISQYNDLQPPVNNNVRCIK